MIPDFTQKENAILTGGSVRAIQRANRVVRIAPDLADDVSAGRMTLGEAERVACKRRNPDHSVRVEAQAALNAIRRLRKKLEAEGWATTTSTWGVISQLEPALAEMWTGIRHMADDA